MKSSIVLLAFSALFASHPTPGSAAEPPAASKEAQSKPALTKEQSLLAQALANQSKLPSFHVEVVLKTKEGNATMIGALGEGTLSLLCTDVKGAQKHRLVAGGEFYLSEDGGKTWKKGDMAEKEMTLFFNNIITAPIALQQELLKDIFTSKQEKFGDDDVLHLEKPAKGESAAVHFWLGKEPALQDGLYLRKAELMISATDIELPATITYSKLGQPVKITAPESK